MKSKPKTPTAGWTTYGVDLPPSVAAIIEAANGADPAKGGMPFAMASITGALPYIAVALYKTLPPAEYAEFAGQLKANLQQVWTIAGSENPPAAFDAAIAAAKKALQ